MNQKLTLFVESPFSGRDYDRFGVDILRKYFDVQVLDLTPWINPHFWKLHANIAHSFSGYHAVSDFGAIVGLLPGTDAAIDILGSGVKADRLRRYLKKAGIPRAIQILGLLPPLPAKSLWQKILDLRFRSNVPLVLASVALRGLMNRLYRRPDPEIAVLSGKDCLKVHGIQDARHIWTHSYDYDIYLGVRDSVFKPRKPYVVYTDEDCAFHTDFAHNHQAPLVKAENFYPALMRFFTAFEVATGMEVVIAAHPRSRWDLYGSFLEGRRPVMGQTAQLISGASLVFAHASTSISYAVLFGVPVVLLTSDEMDKSAYLEELQVRADLLRTKIINIDHVGARMPYGDLLLKPDAGRYSEYRERFIKRSGTPDMPCWEIFAAAMRNSE
jgi:hypothetical protein